MGDTAKERKLKNKLMPQLDNLTYLPQVFWVTLFFSLWYAISALGILPAVLQQLNTRQLLLAQSSSDQKEASAGTTEVVNRVVRGSVNGGETEASDRSAAVSHASQVLGSTKQLAAVIVGGRVEEAR